VLIWGCTQQRETYGTRLELRDQLHRSRCTKASGVTVVAGIGVVLRSNLYESNEDLSMRLAAVLACLSVAAIHPALAAGDPPAPPATPAQDESAEQAPTAAPTTDSAPAAEKPTSATATAPATAPADADAEAARVEKRMHARGYTTRMRNGEKVFCKREEVLGSRLSGAVHCMTADEARVNESRMQQEEELLRQKVMGSCVPNGTGKGANCGS
jgi:hypothetical protein